MAHPKNTQNIRSESTVGLFLSRKGKENFLVDVGRKPHKTNGYHDFVWTQGLIRNKPFLGVLLLCRWSTN